MLDMVQGLGGCFLGVFVAHYLCYAAVIIEQPCLTRLPLAPWRPRYTFLAPSVSTLFEPIININSNFKTKTFLNV
jgi:hypothetical protein